MNGAVLAYLSALGVFVLVIVLATIWAFRRSRQAVQRHHEALAEERRLADGDDPEPESEPDRDPGQP